MGWLSHVGATKCAICDGWQPWSGTVALAIAPLRASQGTKTVWNKIISVGPVPPGEALSFWAQNASAIECPSSPCWLYGGLQQVRVRLRIPDQNEVLLEQRRISHCTCVSPQEARDSQHQVGISLRADIGVPLQSLKSLLNSNKLPKANVSAAVSSSNATAAEVTVTASSSAAAALYVHFTTASHGQFADSGFHLLSGEERTVGFTAWAEFGSLDVELFEQSLHVHWLNVE